MKQLTIFCLTVISAIPLAAGTVTVTFTGANGQTDSSGNLISPYYGTINNVQTTLYCDDFANEVSPGQTWTANVTNLASLSGLPSNAVTNTRYFNIMQTLATTSGTANFTGYQLYEMAAWLTTQLTPNGAQNGDVQDTLWDLFNPNAGNPGVNPPLPSSNAYLFAAEANYSSINPADYYIVTNINVALTGADQVQEFIIMPEPSTILLFGAGLMALAMIGRRRLVSKSRA